MADWGAGWRQAAEGVVNAVGMFQRNQAMIKQEAADRARQRREERLQMLRIEMEKQKMQEDTRRYEDEKSMRKQEMSWKSKESELDRQVRREENEADRGLRERSLRIQEQYASRSAGGGSSGGGLAQSQGPNQKDIDAARQMVSTLMEKEKLSAAQAEERVAQMFSEEVAQRAFPGRAERMGQNNQTLQRGLSAARRFLPDSFFQQ